MVVNGVEDGTGFSGSWSVIAYAMCATPPVGLQRVVATSPSDSQPDKFIPATCPAGKRVLGAGGEIGNGSGQVILGELVPSPADPTQVFANAFEDENGFAGNWTVTSYAICAAASQLVTESSPFRSDPSVTMIASCSADQVLTGMGGDITGGAGQVVIDDLLPQGPPQNRAVVMALEDETGFVGAWFLRAHAICATPLAGLGVSSSSSPTNSTDKGVTATCPTGTKVVGAGGDIVGAGGQVVLTGIAPNSTLTSVSATAREDSTGYASDWSVTAHALCATPPRGLQLVSASSPFDFDSRSVTATCPAGKNVVGAAGKISLGNGEVILDDVTPDPLLRSVTVTGLVGENGSVNWIATAHAICATF